MKETELTNNLPLRVVEDILKNEKGKDFSNILVLFPNKRPAYYIIKYLQEKLGTSFFPPKIFSIDEFVKYLASEINPGLHRVDELNKVWILYKVIREMGLFSNYDFHHFFFWGIKIADIIDEIELEEVNEKKLNNLPPGSIPKEIGKVISHLGKVKENFYKELKNANLSTRGFDYKIVADNLNKVSKIFTSGVEPSGSFRRIYIAGFFAPTHLENKILEFLKSFESTMCFATKEWENWKFKNVHLYSGFDIHSEVKKVGDILKNGFDATHTAIVLPQSDALIPLLSIVVSNLKKEYNISMGYPLDRTSPYTILKEIMNLQETKIGDEYYTKDYLSFLFNPYIKNLSTNNLDNNIRSTIHKIEIKLSQESRKPFVKLGEIEKEFKDITDIHIPFIRNMEKIKTFSELGSCFESIFSFILSNSPAQFYPLSGEFFQQFFEIFKEMQNSIFGNEKMEKEDLFDLFHYYVRTVHVPFSGIPLGGLQVLGMLETRNLVFDKVIIMDVQEGIIPNEDKYDPLLPTSVRNFLGLPTYKDKEKIFRHHFMDLINNASDVHLIYKEHGKNVRSRFIEEIIWEMEKTNGSVAPDDIIKPIDFKVNPKSKPSFSIQKEEKTIEILKSMNFSPTTLDTYLKCPARFYFSSVLQIKERKNIERDPDASEIGSCIHTILQKFYRPFLQKEVILKDNDKKRIKEIIDEEIKNKFGKIRGEIYLLKKIVEFRLLQFFKYEMEKKNLKILDTERKLRTFLDGIPITGVIDRVDQREEKIFIIDYKTGSYSLPIKSISSPIKEREEMKKKIKSFQLPIYLYLYRKENSQIDWKNINGAFYSIKELEEKFIFKENDSHQELMEKIFLPTLQNLIREILNPAVNFERDNEDENYCKNCPYSIFC